MDPSFRPQGPPPSYVRQPEVGQGPAFMQEAPQGNSTVTAQPMPPKKGRGILKWLLILVLLAGAAGGGYFYANKKTIPAATTPVATTPSDLLPSNQQAQVLTAYGFPLALKDKVAKTTVTLPSGARGVISSAQPASLGADAFMPPNILNDFLGAFLIAPALPNTKPVASLEPQYVYKQDSSVFVYDATAWSQSAVKDPKGQAPSSSTPAQKKAWLDGLVAAKQTKKCDLTKNSLGQFGGDNYLETTDGKFVGCFTFKAAAQQAPGLAPLVTGDLVYQSDGRSFLIDFTYQPKLAVMYTADNAKPENQDKAQIQAKYKTIADMPEAKAFIDSLAKTTFELTAKTP